MSVWGSHGETPPRWRLREGQAISGGNRCAHVYARRSYRSVRPPSIVMISPVVKLDASEAR